MPTKTLRLSLILGAVLAAAIFAFDLLTPLGVAGGVPYVGLVLIALVARLPRTALWLAALGSLLTVLGYFLSPAGIATDWIVVTNRVLAIFAIWATAIVTYRHLRTMARLRPLAHRDDLTGLYNRRYFNAEASRQISAWRRHRQPLSLIILDIDHFKKINDTHSHVAGDRVLKTLAETLRQHAREFDTICRYGGEEFVILLPFTDLAGALAKAEQIRAAVSALAVPWGEGAISLKVSMGVAEYQDAGWNAGALVAAADQALYQAKSRGRDRIVAASALPTRSAITAEKTG